MSKPRDSWWWLTETGWAEFEASPIARGWELLRRSALERTFGWSNLRVSHEDSWLTVPKIVQARFMAEFRRELVRAGVRRYVFATPGARAANGTLIPARIYFEPGAASRDVLAALREELAFSTPMAHGSDEHGEFVVIPESKDRPFTARRIAPRKSFRFSWRHSTRTGLIELELLPPSSDTAWTGFHRSDLYALAKAVLLDKVPREDIEAFQTWRQTLRSKTTRVRTLSPPRLALGLCAFDAPGKALALLRSRPLPLAIERELHHNRATAPRRLEYARMVVSDTLAVFGSRK